jgi:hypothetical protein
MTPDEPVTEEAIDAVEKLRSNGEFATSLDLTQKMLASVQNDDYRMRLLFNVVSCAASLDRPDVVEAVMAEFETLPKPEISRVLANLTELGRRRALEDPQMH